MPEQRVAMKPEDFLYLECYCAQCKRVTPISLNPPKEDKAVRECLGCGTAFSPSMNILIKKLQENFSTLCGTPDFDLRFIVKQ